MAPSPSSSDQQPQRKKRRQNVACDSCRLRRVKCDMLAILTPKDTTKAVPPLHVLVRENPDVSCSNCISKGIHCTTNQIVNPAKPNKGGKRIEEAKKMYGSDGTALTPPSGCSGQQTPLPVSSAPRSSSAALDSAGSGSNTQYSLTPVDSTGLGLDLNNCQDGVFLHTDSYNDGGMGMLPGTSTSSLVDPALLDPRSMQKPWNVEWGNTAFSTPYGTPFAGGMYDSTFAYLSPPTPAGAPTFASPSESPVPSIDPSLDATYGTYAPPTYGPVAPQPKVPHPHVSSSLPAPSIMDSSNLRTERFSSTGDSFAYHFLNRLALNESPPQIAGRKRTLSGEGDGLFSLDEIYESGTVPNPWGSPPIPETDHSVRWSRREQVAERLADRALESELSRHLVRVYFQAVHLTLPGISPESFFLEWRRAGERSDRMSPPEEVLCAVLEAWAARFSDHPVVLGFDPKDPAVYHYSPKVILDTGQFVPASPDRPDRSDFGQKRLPVCIALVNRVRRLIDFHGILRKPSVAGVQALVLFTQLQHMTDVDGESEENLMETEMMHGIALSQMKVLKMTWATEEHNYSFISFPSPSHAKGVHWRFIRLFWTLVVSDSFWAAASCKLPKVLDDEMEATHRWMEELENMDGPPQLKKIAFFLKAYFGYCTIGRKIARKLSVPSTRPGRLDMDEFCKTIREVWSEVRALHNDVNTRAKHVLSDNPEQLLGTSPVHSLAALRQCGTFLLLIIHHIVSEVVSFRKTILASYGDSSSAQKTVEAERLASVEELHEKSIDNLLAIIRAQTPLFKRLLPTGMLQASSMMIRVLLSSAEFLSVIPTNEQGYPNTTLGGIEWTWAHKEREVGHCIAALYQLGWAWSDVAPTLDKVKKTMERMRPDVQTLMAYAAESKPRGYRDLVERRDRDLERNAASLEAAMLYWPPRCVPMTLDLIYDHRHAQSLSQSADIEPANSTGTGSKTKDKGARVLQEIFQLPISEPNTSQPSAPETQPVGPAPEVGEGGELVNELDELLASIINAEQPAPYV